LTKVNRWKVDDVADLIALQKINAERWAVAHLTRGPEFVRYAKVAVNNRQRYASIVHRCGMALISWVFVAVAHYRESGQDFTTNLGQGDPLNKKTVHVPAGRGPFRGPEAFEDGAVDALVDCAPFASRNSDWSIGGMLTYLERYNGLAYANAGMASPYIWSGTNQYQIGKIVVDHGPIMPVVDKQLGCAGLILAMMQLDPTIVFDQESPPVVDVFPPLVLVEDVYDAVWLQTSLNKLGATPPLVVDGIIGSATRTAVRAFQKANKLYVDGVAGSETIPAIKRALTAFARLVRT
jgi:lysozyme family protein